MRVMFVAPWIPTNRRPRSLGLLRAISSVHEVHLVAVAWSPLERAESAALEEMCESVRIVSGNPKAAAMRAGLAVASRRSLQQAYVNFPAIRRTIHEVAETVRPDLAYFNVIRSAQFVEEAGPCVRVLDMDEIRSDYYVQMKEMGATVGARILGRLEAQRMRRAEAAAARAFDLILVSGPTDVGRIAKSVLVRSPHVLGSSSAGPGRRNVREDRASARYAVFVGRLGYAANRRAIEWLVRNVLPLVPSNRRIALKIVGESPPRSIQKLKSRMIEVVPNVQDVTPYYDHALVSVIPVKMATGVQMKLVESLSRGVPTICTPTVAALAGVTPGLHCLVADDERQWAVALGEVVESRELRERLSKAGQAWAREHYDADRISQSLLAFLADSVRSN